MQNKEGKILTEGKNEIFKIFEEFYNEFHTENKETIYYPNPKNMNQESEDIPRIMIQQTQKSITETMNNRCSDNNQVIIDPIK